MGGKGIFVWLLILITVVASQAISQDTVEQVRQKAISGLRSGNLVRVYSDDLGAVGGKLIECRGDTLYLEADKRAKAGGKPSRRVMRRGRSSYDRMPKWMSVEQPTLVAFSSVRELHARGNSAKTGAVVGSVILGSGSLILGALMVGLDPDGFTSSDYVSLTIGGLAAGGLFGAVVGVAIPAWKVRYREPGFQAEINLYPVLSVKTNSQQLNSATLYVGIGLNW